MTVKSESRVAAIVAREVLSVVFNIGAACTGGIASKSEMTHHQKDDNTRV
jgi:hypothetical protein